MAIDLKVNNSTKRAEVQRECKVLFSQSSKRMKIIKGTVSIINTTEITTKERYKTIDTIRREKAIPMRSFKEVNKYSKRKA